MSATNSFDLDLCFDLADSLTMPEPEVVVESSGSGKMTGARASPPEMPTSTPAAPVSGTCTICMEDFESSAAAENEVDDDDAKQLPCNHVYHGTCIASWLSLHNSCPLCRYNQ